MGNSSPTAVLSAPLPSSFLSLLIAEPWGCFLNGFRLAGSSCCDRIPQPGSLKDMLVSQSWRPDVPDGGAARFLGRACRRLPSQCPQVVQRALVASPGGALLPSVSSWLSSQAGHLPWGRLFPLPANPFPISCQVSSWEGPGISTSAACGVSSVAHCHGRPPGLC